jgi:ribosomal-protein-alanine N-acetyltransferase
VIEAMRWWDIDAIMEIERDVFDATAWSPAQFWSELAQPDRTYVVVRHDERIVGYAGLMARRPTADVQTIAVAPAHRRRGIARAMLTRLLEIAEASDCREVLLEVRADGVEAIALYRSEGFEVIARRADYYGSGEDALIMRRRPS